ncbi:IdsF, partial [Pectobacterium parmentieri]|nr:IdsF [Pectobacterium parmentieri]
MIFSRASYNLSLFLLKMATFLLLVLVFPAKAEEEIKEKYLISFKTYKSTCLL